VEGELKMTKKIKAYLDFEDFDICKSPNDLMFYVRGYFNKLAFEYRNMTISEIKSQLEDLKVVFEFLDKRGFENE
jgi:hypothetical protein